MSFNIGEYVKYKGKIYTIDIYWPEKLLMLKSITKQKNFSPYLAPVIVTPEEFEAVEKLGEVAEILYK